MSVIEIQGLRSLKGEIRIQGSKNAVLPIMAACLLHKGTITITNVPGIQDVFCMKGILEFLGCGCELEGHTLTVDARQLSSCRIPEEEGKRMRSSIMLLGPLLGRMGEAIMCHPGGCSIGERPVDLHIKALRDLGASIQTEGETIHGVAARLVGGDIHLAFPSVGATENAVLAAVAASGVTRIYGAAMEPEIRILCKFLKSMGAQIEGIGTRMLMIRGGRPLHDTVFAVPGDRIVAGTYLGTVTAAGGDVLLRGIPSDQMRAVLTAAAQMGATLQYGRSGSELLVSMKRRPQPIQLETGPYPEFPTDLQSMMLAAAAVAEGTSTVCENIFEARFATAKELQKLGAQIIIEGRTARITGRCPLYGAEVEALDLRGGAALVAAGLAAEGRTRIGGYHFIHRGYEDICRDLAQVGADIRLTEPLCDKDIRNRK